VVGMGDEPRKYDGLLFLGISEERHQVAALVVEGGKRRVVVDGREGPPFERTTTPVFVPGRGGWAYAGVVVEGGEPRLFLVTVDSTGTEHSRGLLLASGPLVSVDPPVFSDDGKHVACACRTDAGTWFVSVNGEKGPLFGDIGQQEFVGATVQYKAVRDDHVYQVTHTLESAGSID